MSQEKYSHSIAFAKEYLELVIDVCKNVKLMIRGTLIVEDGVKVPLPITFKAFPNGDWVAWLFEDNHFILLALVNERMKHVMTVHQDNVKELESAIAEIEKEIGK